MQPSIQSIADTTTNNIITAIMQPSNQSTTTSATMSNTTDSATMQHATIPTTRDFKALLRDGLDAAIRSICAKCLSQCSRRSSYMQDVDDLVQDGLMLLQTELDKNAATHHRPWNEFKRVFCAALSHATYGKLRRYTCAYLTTPDDMLKMVSRAYREHRDSDTPFTVEELYAAYPASRRSYLRAAYEAWTSSRAEATRSGKDNLDNDTLLEREYDRSGAETDVAYDDLQQELQRFLAGLKAEERALAANIMSGEEGKDRATCALLGISQPTLRKKRAAFLARLRELPLFAELQLCR